MSETMGIERLGRFPAGCQVQRGGGMGVKNYTSISCHKTDSAAGPSHSAGAKMQFWLTLAISCNCNTPSSHEVMAGRSASSGSVRTMPALGLQQRCVAAFRVAFLTTPARVPTPGLSAA